MIKTHGLTHIALAVKNAKRSFEFYRKVFGVIKIYDQNGWIQAQTPGARDIIVFDESAPRTGKPGGIAHLVFVLSIPRKLAPLPKRSRRRAEKFSTRASFVRVSRICFSEIWTATKLRSRLNCRRQ
jgi:catechol 2,3-dioxygenase-like lactoylglutathione lyase family enzyme